MGQALAVDAIRAAAGEVLPLDAGDGRPGADGTDGHPEGGGGVGLRLLGFVECVQLRKDRSDAPSGVGEDRSGQREDAIAGLDE